MNEPTTGAKIIATWLILNLVAVAFYNAFQLVYSTGEQSVSYTLWFWFRRSPSLLGVCCILIGHLLVPVVITLSERK